MQSHLFDLSINSSLCVCPKSWLVNLSSVFPQAWTPGLGVGDKGWKEGLMPHPAMTVTVSPTSLSPMVLRANLLVPQIFVMVISVLVVLVKGRT